MIRVEEAEKIILQQCRDFGTEMISFENCLGRVLAENIVADRDFPPFNRATMDGIAIHFDAYQKGLRSFKIKATQAAGEYPSHIDSPGECIEIMTGAALSATINTVVPYEAIEIINGVATIHSGTVAANQNTHPKGIDQRQHDIVAAANQVIDETILAVAATVGKTNLLVKKNPAVIIISTGDELVDIHETPTDFQLRRSNGYTLQAMLKTYLVHADTLHLPDDPVVMHAQLERCIHQYDVIILSGGVSMGKFDYVPTALEKLSVKKLFHKVQQRPGKPFWFGTHPQGTLVFAFPGNPVSAFMCFHRYFLPWLKASWQIKTNQHYAMLTEEVSFKLALQYFLQVQLHIGQNALLCAAPIAGNGSGDFINLLHTNAFMELPLEKNEFKKGEIFPVWPFKKIF